MIGERILKLFQDLVRDIKDAECLSEYEQKQLLTLGIRPNSIPMSFGYEVTPLMVENDHHSCGYEGSVASGRSTIDSRIDNGSMTRLAASMTKEVSVRVNVKLTSDKVQFMDDRESNDVVLESNGITTYCISENPVDEEGLEVVGLGRYNTIVVEAVETYEEELRESMSTDTLEVDDLLTRAFSSNEHVQVAYFLRTEEEEEEEEEEEAEEEEENQNSEGDKIKME
jgi:hypothetical protein